jgi:c-di-GMP-binding flagellar brake protein YcgR
MEVHVNGPTKDSAQVALQILSQKQFAWQHEEEVRVFTRDPFVHVDIQKVCFGCNINRTDRELIKALVKMTAPEAQLVQLQRRQLDKPLDTFKH